MRRRPGGLWAATSSAGAIPRRRSRARRRRCCRSAECGEDQGACGRRRALLAPFRGGDQERGGGGVAVALNAAKTRGPVGGDECCWRHSAAAIKSEAEEVLPRSEEHTSELQSLRHLVC